MRTGSHRLAGTLVALGFLAGWFSAAWVSPPTAATQVAPPRTVTPAPDVALPRIALGIVTAPETAPATARNPFVFADRRPAAPAPLDRASDHMDGEPVEEEVAAASPVGASPGWRLFGIAADADGHLTAMISGRGDVWLVALGDTLPDGAAVAAIDAGGVELTRTTGERFALRLP